MALHDCEGYWKDNPQQTIYVTICDGDWDGVEDAADEGIFFYTNGDPVLGDHGEFVITSAIAMCDWEEA